MTRDEALKMARTALGVQLDALLGKAGHLRNDDRRRYAENGIKAIDEALAQPEQKPRYGYKGKCNRVMSNGNPCGLNAPCPDCGLSLIDCPQPQPWEKFCDSNCVWTDHHPDCKLAEQKPVALETVYETIIQWDEGGGKRSRRELAKRIVSLYTTPPQRKPLTDEEIRLQWSEFWETECHPWAIQFARAIEAAHGIKGEA